MQDAPACKVAAKGMPLDTIPLGLKQALESGECVLFIGAGIGRHLADPHGKNAPDAAELAQDLATFFGIASPSKNLAKVAQIVEGRKGRPALDDYLRKRLAHLEPDNDLRWLFSLRWRAIFTTNYDSGIERAYALNQKPLQKPISVALTSELQSHDPRFEVPIYHLHGALFGSQSKIVITQNDYAHFRDRRNMLFELLKKEFATSNILYIGYSNLDPNWDLVLEEITGEFYPSPLPPSYRVAPSSDPLDIEILRSKNIESLDCDFQHFAALAAPALVDLQIDPDRLKKVQATVPHDLIGAFERNPAPVARLVASWVYVNGAPFSAPPNTKAFLEGDRPSWSTISRHDHFERDIEEDLYDEVLDYATGSSTKPTTLILLGPAGYGATTTMMSLAVKLVRERVGPVFMHKPGTPLLEGDILFGTSLFPNPPIFLVDDAADNSLALQSALTYLRTESKPAVLLLCERINEWRQSKAKLNGKEFLMEPLSDLEIDRLLDCLGKHNALNKIEPLPRHLQFAVIKEKHGKELLVAMKEATAGMGFDAILDSEYRGISSDVSREAYLAVCCFFQHGAYVRDALLAKLLNIDVTVLYERTQADLDGVIIYDEIDEARGIYGARARHRTIATIVWERCGEIDQRDNLLQKAIENLNLVYSQDRAVMEQFVRSDRLVDSIQGLERKIQFFDAACKKEPENPYTRQHYARMLLRSDKADLALLQIDEGMRIADKAPPRVLFHTKAVILSHLALGTESEDIARRRLLQSEEMFRRSIRMNARDEYSYQGLATLYLGWAKRAKSEAESVEYTSKAEEVVNEGLKKVKVREGLWIVSSEIEKWLGDIPSRKMALEKAVEDTPGSPVARYLLGRLYRLSGDAPRALATLEPVLNANHDEFRAITEYALALLDTGRPLREAIAVMRISNTFGLSDSRFISIFGGMLFLNHEFDESSRIFQESLKREFPAEELHAIHYRPKDPATNARYVFEGTIVVIRPRYSLIEVEGYPRFLCHASKYGGKHFTVGMNLRFSVEFSARGAVVDHPTMIHQAPTEA